MKYIKIIVAALALLSLLSCEEIVDNPELPYKEQLVIKAFVYADSNAKNIKITRTLHPLEEYSTEKALVSDAEAYIINNGIKYKLNYDKSTNLYNNLDIKFEKGQKYEFQAFWKNLKVYGNTIIPEQYNYNLTYNKKSGTNNAMIECEIFIEFSPSENYAYDAGEIYYDSYYKKTWFSTRNTYDNSYIKNGKITMDMGNKYFPLYFNDDQIKSALSTYNYYITIFDYAYYKYYLTQYNGDSSNDIFGTSGNNIDWNISGDGVGLFIGGNIKQLNF